MIIKRLCWWEWIIHTVLHSRNFVCVFILKNCYFMLNLWQPHCNAKHGFIGSGLRRFKVQSNLPGLVLSIHEASVQCGHTAMETNLYAIPCPLEKISHIHISTWFTTCWQSTVNFSIVGNTVPALYLSQVIYYLDRDISCRPSFSHGQCWSMFQMHYYCHLLAFHTCLLKARISQVLFSNGLHAQKSMYMQTKWIWYW